MVTRLPSSLPTAPAVRGHRRYRAVGVAYCERPPRLLEAEQQHQRHDQGRQGCSDRAACRGRLCTRGRHQGVHPSDWLRHQECRGRHVGMFGFAEFLHACQTAAVTSGFRSVRRIGLLDAESDIAWNKNAVVDVAWRIVRRGVDGASREPGRDISNPLRLATPYGWRPHRPHSAEKSRLIEPACWRNAGC